jgi:hypothetical protein
MRYLWQTEYEDAYQSARYEFRFKISATAVATESSSG